MKEDKPRAKEEIKDQARERLQIHAAASTGAGAETDTSRYEAYWREHYAGRPYVRAGARYEDYEPAYLFGIHEYVQTDHPKTWDEVKDELGVRWEAHCAGNGLRWQEAEPAVRDAWEHMRDPGGFRQPPARVTPPPARTAAAAGRPRR